jgi:spore coat protein U-like protein
LNHSGIRYYPLKLSGIRCAHTPIQVESGRHKTHEDSQRLSFSPVTFLRRMAMKKSNVAVVLSVAAIIGSLLTPPLSLAATIPHTMPVQAQVSVNCNFTAPSTMTFPAYDPAGANATNPLSGTGTLGVRCTQGATVTIGIDTGAHAGLAAPSTRAMQNGAFNLGYDLYWEASYTNLWTTIAGAGLRTYIPSSNALTNITVYGRIPGGQDVPAGTYNDSVEVTVNY